MRWTASEKLQWRTALKVVKRDLLPGWNARVRLLFCQQPLPGIFALCDPQGMTIGLFPRARKLGPLQRMETLVHECCHLRSRGAHTRSWKLAMTAASRRALLIGERRLAAMIEHDLSLYDRRDVTETDLRRQLARIMPRLTDISASCVVSHLADWAGWPLVEFRKRYPFLPALLQNVRFRVADRRVD